MWIYSYYPWIRNILTETHHLFIYSNILLRKKTAFLRGYFNCSVSSRLYDSSASKVQVFIFFSHLLVKKITPTKILQPQYCTKFHIDFMVLAIIVPIPPAGCHHLGSQPLLIWSYRTMLYIMWLNFNLSTKVLK